MTAFPESRTAVLTGAASPRGIGRYTAHHLAERGWNIGIIDLDADAARAVAAEIAERHGVQAAGAGANVADDALVRAAFDELEAALPPVVALVNLAGIASPVSYLDVTAESQTERDEVLARLLAEGLRSGGISELSPIIPPLSEVYREVTS